MKKLNENDNLIYMRSNKTTLGQRECNACGDGSLELSMKQEKEYMDNHIDAPIIFGESHQ